jgi:uncharacterized protein (TIGR02453 family)
MNSFKGFSKETVKFLKDLAGNNKRDWFNEHKEDFNRYVIEPARGFVDAMGERLMEIAPGIIAEPRVNGSIFRIYRDTRFSKDKTPYKTHLGIFMWEGEGPKMECPGFYFHLEPPNLMLGGGIHIFSKSLLEEYRNSVVHPGHGLALVTAAMKVSEVCNIGGVHYKKVPRGFDKDHQFAQFLLYNGLTAWVQTPIPEEVYSEKIVDYCFDVFKGMAPLHYWLREMIKRVDRN